MNYFRNVISKQSYCINNHAVSVLIASTHDIVVERQQSVSDTVYLLLQNRSGYEHTLKGIVENQA